MPVEILDEKNEKSNSESSKNETSNSKFSFVVPREFVRIPSLGYTYPKDLGMGSTDIEMRYMTAADEDDLTSPSLIRKGVWLSKLLQNCMINKSFDVDELLVGDRNALLFWLRQSAYGSNYELSITCPSCEKKFANEFKLDKLIMKTLDVKPTTLGKNEFSFRLPKMDVEVHFRLTTGKISAELEKEFEIQRNLKTPKEAVITSTLKQQIVEVQGIRDSKTIEDFIDNYLLATDSLALRQYIEKITPDIILKQAVTCPACGTSSEFDIPIEVQFFWPQSR